MLIAIGLAGFGLAGGIIFMSTGDDFALASCIACGRAIVEFPLSRTA